MQRFLCLILLLAAAAHAKAFTDEMPPPSPSGRYAVCNIGDTAQGFSYFEIKDKNGKVLFSRDDLGKLLQVQPQFLSTHAANILWNRDEQAVLFSFDDGNVKATGLFSFAAGKAILLGHVQDGQTVPVRWKDSKSFVIENSGPYPGHHFGGIWHYEQTYQLRLQPIGVKCVYTSPTRREKGDDGGTS